jgi:hypothetical protein
MNLANKMPSFSTVFFNKIVFSDAFEHDVSLIDARETGIAMEASRKKCCPQSEKEGRIRTPEPIYHRGVSPIIASRTGACG